MWRWLERWRQARRIPDDLWHRTVQAHPFLLWLNRQELEVLKRRAEDFLDRKEFHGVDGFVVSDEIAVAVAAQAALPVLHRGMSDYDGFVGVVLHQGPVRARREWCDEAGVVHLGHEDLVGEALDGGPLMLSWQEGLDDAAWVPGPGETAFNVVLHELAHVLDLTDGALDGCPALPQALRGPWRQAVHGAHARCEQLLEGQPDLEGLPGALDVYAATDVGEWFAVSVEAFFTAPLAFQRDWPEVYRLYAHHFGQDPAPRQAAAG